MTEQMIRGREITRPAVTPITSSVLAHATVVDNDNFGYTNNAGLWPSYNCLDLLVPTPTCANPIPGFDYKTFEVAGWVPGFEFAVHGGVQCSAVGLDKADQESEVERVFTLSEGKGIERALLLNRFAASEAVDPDAPTSPFFGVWDAPEDLTPVTPVSLIVALALLEGDAAANYVGLPTIHMPRAAATVLEASGLIVWVGDKAFTKNGSKVAMGGGYDVDLASGEWVMYATGEIYVERSKEFSHQSFVLPDDGSGTGSGENGLGDNTMITLVERMFRVGIDCYVAKATGTVWA